MRCLLLFSHSVVSDSLRPHGQEYARLPCPSLSPRVCSNSCPLSCWCHSTLSSSVIPFSSCLQSFPASGLFQWDGSSHQMAKVLELQFQHQFFQWLFRIDGIDLLAVQEIFQTPQFKSINSSLLRLLYGPTLTFIHGYWKNHSFSCMDFCHQGDLSAF